MNIENFKNAAESGVELTSAHKEIDFDKLIESEKMEVSDTPDNNDFNPDKLIDREAVDNTNEEKCHESDSSDEPNTERISDVDEGELHSSREKRIEMAKRSKGAWSGEPGNSELTPNDAKAKATMEKYGETSIRYKDGVPDFSPFSLETVTIDITPDIEDNRKRAYKAVADKWNSIAKEGKTNWRPRDVAKWKKAKNLDMHECSDMKTVQFVPAEIHQAAKHTGGRHEAKCKENAHNVGGFDE